MILGFVAIACGAALVAYRYSTQPTTLTVAAGSLDGDAPKLMQAIASRLNATNAPVRLKVVDKTTALDAANAFSSGETDLAVVRADVGDLSQARAVMVVAQAVVLLIAPPGSTVTSMDDIKGKTVGVIGAAVNQHVVSVITREYDLERARTRFRELLPMDVTQAIQSKQVQALLVVVPISEKYLARIRDFMPRNTKARGRAGADRIRPARSRTSTRPTKATNCRRARCAVRRRCPTTISRPCACRSILSPARR